ncbi:MAG TPA: TSUP family transporter [Spirochaetota bacterium]|jgi:uncharacterized membrane protein YfcA|nr:TSUP family transporter [Spirochaetota bacterium]HQP49294.1 TSUP family transporter [Spirochaetota bacterium]
MAAIGIGIGLFAGILSGLIGIGGGIVMVPALVLLLGYDQHLSQGTTLAAMVPPIGILAAFEYYRCEHVNVLVACCIAGGFILGGFLGAKIAVNIPEDILKKVFGSVLMVIAVKMIFFE